MGILWAIVALIALGGVAALIGLLQSHQRSARIARGGEVESEEETISSAGGCCGMHMTCERDSLLAAVSKRIVYYDDEELDRYRGTAGDQYSGEAVEEFRDVMITLNEDDVAGWIRSLQLRSVELPDELKPELFLIVGENRAFHMEHGPNAYHDHKN